MGQPIRKAILAHGHVVEGHGYNHEIARYLPRDQESEVMKKTIAMIEKRTGRRPYGWRSCTQSTNTIELLIEYGFVFNTNCFHEELPFLWEKDGKLLVELPSSPPSFQVIGSRIETTRSPSMYYENRAAGGTAVPLWHGKSLWCRYCFASQIGAAEAEKVV